MAKSNGAKLAAHSISHVLQHLRLVANIAVVWSAVVALAVGATCFVIAVSEHSAFSTVMRRMQDGDLLRHYTKVSSIASTFGQIAIAVGWFRYVLLSEAPQFTLTMPKGSARYFSRSVILVFGLVALAIPGFIAGAVVGSLVPGDGGKIAAGIVMGIGALVAAYVCIRAWLVFPAIAIGDDGMDFRRSFKLAKGFVPAIVVGTIVAYVPFMLVAVVIVGIATASDMYLDGTLYIAATLLSEFAETFLIFGAVAASAGVLARIYRDAVPDARPNPEQIAAFE